MAVTTSNACCPITGGLTRANDCALEVLVGASSTVFIAPLCAIASYEEFDCADAGGPGIADIVMGTGANDFFYSFQSRDNGVDGTITGTRNDTGTYTGTNTLTGEYYGFSQEAKCRITELKGSEIVAIVCMKDGTTLVFGLDGGLVLNNWTFTISTGILQIGFTNENGSLPCHLVASLGTLFVSEEDQINAIVAP